MAPKGLRQPLHGRDWVGLWDILWLPFRVHYTIQATIRITIKVTVIKGHYARDYMGLRKIFFCFFSQRFRRADLGEIHSACWLHPPSEEPRISSELVRIQSSVVCSDWYLYMPCIYRCHYPPVGQLYCGHLTGHPYTPNPKALNRIPTTPYTLT